MNDRDWQQLSDLLEKVVNLNLPTWQDKLEELKANVDEVALEEFPSWLVSLL